ncbi:sigma 54-interacting transcriptional regulator [Desulfosporosinus sp. BICA1-9]|uniref:sigma 54-interacting transcriptional regulator n=1 Tax=Desulfosporosinus sp. BICA1-9 TaxID=1531958 RepID=UPI000A53FFAE|nr:sigma 54-interacting transcriptional regulator [Desulfosporosinus sp. BICA1-9]HBW36243.1 transcriptional regulator [Desulfosporosinus sp.]
MMAVDEQKQVLGIVRPSDLASDASLSGSKLQERIRNIFDVANSGIIVVDEHGIIVIANRVVADIVGVANNELVGRLITDVIPNSLLPKILESGQALYGQKIVINAIPVVANYSPMLETGVIRNAVCVFHDLSSIDHLSKELNSVKQLFREYEAIINSSYDGIFITDGNGLVLRLNNAYERITGIQANEVVGKTMKQLVSEGVYDQSATLRVIEKRHTITIAQTIKRTNKQILVTGNPVFDEEGKLSRVVTNVRDITELNSLQNQLQETKEQTLKYEAELNHLRSLQIQDTGIIFGSELMARAIQLAMKVACVDTTVLITGESGTGKELFAKLIHEQGKGISKPFIKINCAAIPEQLLESELFGYEGGAFTGAKKEGKPGLLELAHKGTLFLDEMGEMPLLLQVKLLRAIQEKEIVRVGSTKTIQINVKIITATNRDLARMVDNGTFREDLFYRLMVVPIQVPPLRERKEDIPLLVKYIVDKLNKRFAFNHRISPHLLDKLSEHSWPGNVRELENVLERMMITSSEEELTVNLLPDTIRHQAILPKRGTKLKDAVAQTEAYILEETYKEYQSWQKVAEVLGVDRTTIFRKLGKYGLKK